MAMEKDLLKNFARKPVTLCYPFERRPVVEGTRARVTWDIEKCIGCSLCVRVCPSNAIQLIGKGKSGEIKYFVTRCIFCGECVDVCPTNAIRTTTEFELVFTNRECMTIDFKRKKDKSEDSNSNEGIRIGGR